MVPELKTDANASAEQAAQVLPDHNGASRGTEEQGLDLESTERPPLTFAWPRWDHEIIANICRILNSAARLTGLPFSVADEQLHYFAWSDNAHFCHSFAHVQCPGLKEKCAQCEKLLLERMSKNGSPFSVYHCEVLGVDDLFVPVRHRGRLVLVINCGVTVTDSTRLPEICDRLTVCGCQIPRLQLQAAVQKRLPIVKPSQIEYTLELIQGVAALLEELIAMRWERSKLKYATRLDAPIRRLIRDFGCTRGNPLNTMSEIAGLLAEAVGADACCVWKKDVDRHRLFTLTTSGFDEAEVLNLSPLDLEASLTGRVIHNAKAESVDDVDNYSDRAALPLKESLLGMGYKALLCVPVRFDDEIPGAVTVYRHQAGSFHVDDAELLQELASYIWAAISTATFARHSVAQAAITHLLNVDHDSVQLYDNIASKVRDWVGARACCIFFRRGQSDLFDLRGTTGVKGNLPAAAYKKGSGLTGTVARTGRPLRVYDCRDVSELYALGDDLHWSKHIVDAVEDELPTDAVRSWMAAPITVASEVCGVIRVYVASLHRSVFSPEDEALLGAVALELGEAWKRFRLGEQVTRIFEDTKAVLEDVQAVHQAVAAPVAAAQDRPKEVVRLLMERVTRRYPAWRWVNLRIPDEQEQFLQIYSIIGPQADAAISLNFPIRLGESLGADSYLKRQAIRVPDISYEQRYRCPFAQHGARSCFMLPMVVAKKCIGILTVDSTQLDDFDENAQEYLKLLVTQLATALMLSKSVEAVSQAGREKQAYLEALSHQLIAPLFATRTHCENLLEGRLSVERAKKVLVAIAAQSRIAARTASNIGILTNILMGRAPGTALRKSKRNVARMLTDLARDYQPLAWADNKKMFARFQGCENLLVAFDLRTFPQAVGNIVENAVKYSNDFTEILIRLSADRSAARIEVTSEGIPLSAKEAEQIFAGGFRSQAAQLKFPPGTGIGLRIARSIVEAHGGKVYAIPTDHRGRTTFVIEMPND